MQHFLLKQRWESADKRKLHEIEKRIVKTVLFFFTKKEIKEIISLLKNKKELLMVLLKLIN